jgi:hypothetical protein
MKRLTLFLLLIPAFAFCGFYVAKADASLFNKASQVILVRSGDQTVVTMQSDFQGSVKDFAMVIPVPEVPQKEAIRVADMNIFNKLDGYSGPRLVEYFDEHPCEELFDSFDDLDDGFADDEWAASPAEEEKLGVTIEARYSVGEYDILILSAVESSGLEKWLIREGYNIPKGAQEALRPYIKNGLKFFVAKVNLEAYDMSGSVELRPIQVTYRTNKFRLPIRLGMANAEGTQDMIVYVLTDQGRAEVTNYRTVEMPTDRDIPTFVEKDFGTFYQKTFTGAWEKAGKNVALLEYAWDIGGQQAVKCDPCPTPPLVFDDLREAGAFWVKKADSWGGQVYSGDLFITRLHVRYDRKHFPQDLQFQVTPNTERFQCRYVMQQPAMYDLYCQESLPYLKNLIKRRKTEIQTYTELTGIVANDATRAYVKEAQTALSSHVLNKRKDKGSFWLFVSDFGGNNWPWLLLLFIAPIVWFTRTRRPTMLSS